MKGAASNAERLRMSSGMLSLAGCGVLAELLQKRPACTGRDRPSPRPAELLSANDEPDGQGVCPQAFQFLRELSSTTGSIGT
jgi:hypothetical protein